MNILIVSKCPTHPTTAGNRMLILSYAELLKRQGHDIHFLFVSSRPLSKINAANAIESREKTRSYWKDRFHEYKLTTIENILYTLRYQYRRRFCKYWGVDDEYPSGLGKFTERLQQQQHFDACIVNYIYLSKLLKYITIPKVAIFTHDYYTFKDVLTDTPHCDKALMPNEEAKGLKRAKYIFAMQEDEATIFHALSPKSKIYINYSYYNYVSQPIAKNHNIVFLSGSNNYNINGLRWFIENIWHTVIDKVPDAKLLIGGAICKAITNASNQPGIELQGLINDISAFYAQGNIAINPTYQGTGLKIKTFEAISMSKVTIVHPHSTIGIYKKDSAPLLSSANPEDWVSFILKIWKNPIYIEKIKKEDEHYIAEMNTFIESQYRAFLQD